MLPDPPITRAAKKREEDIKNMADLGQGDVLVDPEVGDDDQQVGAGHLSPESDDAVTQSATKSNRRPRKKRETKTEKRFQRLEAMMAQIIQGQAVARTPVHHPTPATAAPWQPNPDASRYGLPRPTIPLPTQLNRETPHQPPRMTLAAQLGRRHDAPPPAPEALIEDPTAAGHIAEVIKHLEPVFQGTGGKRNHVLKPHLFIPRRFASKKATDKEDISFPLFVNGMAGIILNSLNDQGMVAAALCRHLHEAAEDTAIRPWPVAREWSKTIFDRIERGEISWNHYNEIQRERLHSALAWVPPEKALYPCALFNGKACQEPDSHTEDGVTFRHVCAYCHYANNTIKPHPFKQCTAKRGSFTPRSSSLPPNARSAKQKQTDPESKN